jgi:hypothetical protein
MSIPRKGLIAAALVVASFTVWANMHWVNCSRNDSAIDPFTNLISGTNAARFEILCLPRYVETPARLSPRQLEAEFLFKVDVEEFHDSKLRTQFVSVFEKSSIKTTKATDADFRWDCIFYDAAGRRVLTIYLDAKGKNAIIGGVPVALNGRLVKFLNKKCAKLWE